MNKLFALSKNTFKETIRDRILLSILFFAILFILASQLAAEISARENDKITMDLGLAMINIFGVIIAIFTGTSLIYKEINEKTIFALLSKPIKKSTFIFSKFLALAAVLFLITVFCSIIFFFMVPFSFVFLIVIFLMYLSFLLLLSVVLFLSSFMRPLLAAFSAIFVFITGHITEDIKIIASENSDSSGIFKIFADFVYYLWPNFEILNLKNIAIYPEAFSISPLNFSIIVLMTLVYIVILLYAASLIFSRKEF